MKKSIAILLAIIVMCYMCACANSSSDSVSDLSASEIEEKLNLKNNSDQEWSYSNNAWTLSVVIAVANAELPDQQGVSVCVPAAYIKGVDTDGDGKADVTTKNYSSAVKGSLVIDYDNEVTSSNGQKYTAKTAPVILNTGAAGYGSQTNQTAQSTYAADGYINAACGNRGKQDTVTSSSGNTAYTGDAPSCLVDQKNAARFIKYNILLGNLPGCVDYFVSTGGSGGGAHAAMFAATSNNSDFYDYEIEAGAVGVYKNSDGSYSTEVTINGKKYNISDGAWGCIAYSAITSLYEGDMTLAFEYYLNKDYSFNTSFQKKLGEYLSEEYMDYINEKKLSVKESAVGFDLNNDGDKKDTVKLYIKRDKKKYPETNGYYGTYLDLYLAEFTQNLQWYVDNLDYADGWTWFGSDGKALSDKEVASMTSADKAEAFIEGRYSKSTSGSNDNKMGGGMPGGNAPDMNNSGSKDMKVGTPNGGTTQSSSSSTDSSNYSSYSEMLKAYQSDISEIQKGDEYGNNIVSLYNPLNYIGAESTENPTWTRIVMGASEGDMSMFASLNLQIQWLNSGVDSEIEWQWDGGHVPSEVFGESLSLYVDEMYGKYVSGAVKISKPAATKQTKNGSQTSASGTDISSWVSYKNGKVSFSLKDAAAYRTNGASKATPGFDVIDYGQEDYVFGNDSADARHWDVHLLNVLEKHKTELSKLFNSGS